MIGIIIGSLSFGIKKISLGSGDWDWKLRSGPEKEVSFQPILDPEIPSGYHQDPGKIPRFDMDPGETLLSITIVKTDKARKLLKCQLLPIHDRK